MTTKTRHVLAATALGGLLVALCTSLTTSEAAAQTTLRACYIPKTGIVYRIGLPDTPDACHSHQHVEFSWTDAGGADHGALAGLADDDHTQYVLADGVRGTTNGFAVTGTFGTGSIPVSGAGERIMWYPAKVAFRVGVAGGSQWDDANIGIGSVAMGVSTTASAIRSTAMGSETTASGDRSTAMGQRTMASGELSTAMGADTEASGRISTAMGGSTTASGDQSTAMGSFASTNGKRGSFVYGDGSFGGLVVNAQVDNSFVVRAAGGTTFYSNASLTSGVSLASGGGAWASVSDRNRKADFRTEDGEAVLTTIAALPIQSWSYKSQAPSIRHIGPTAQDFYAAFGLGEGELTITTTDIDGVNLLAVQALEKRTAELRAENARLRERLTELEAMLRSLVGKESN